MGQKAGLICRLTEPTGFLEARSALRCESRIVPVAKDSVLLIPSWCREVSFTSSDAEPSHHCAQDIPSPTILSSLKANRYQ